MSEEVMKAETYDIMLPMYAVVNQTSNTGVIADVVEGAAQMELYADISGRGSEIYNKHYFRIHYRESQTIKVSSVSQPIDKYNHSFMNNDISVDFRFLGKEVVQNGYSGVAKEYRELLIDRYDMHDKYDETEDLVIDIDVIGGYDFKNNIFGIVYKDKDTLTTFAQLKEMIRDIENSGFEYINVFYKGWRKEGLIDASYKNIKVYDKLGNLNTLKEVNDMLILVLLTNIKNHLVLTITILVTLLVKLSLFILMIYNLTFGIRKHKRSISFLQDITKHSLNH